MELDVTMLRLLRGRETVTVATLCDLLEALAEERPELSPAICAIASNLHDLPAREAPSKTARSHGKWTWPLPAWEEWQENLVGELSCMPTTLERNCLVHIKGKGKGKGKDGQRAFAQIVGKEGGFTLQIYDPADRFGDLSQIAWSPYDLEGMPGTFWLHDFTMSYVEGVVERLAQGLALGVGVTDLNKLTIDWQ